jgi:hypothetical protein
MRVVENERYGSVCASKDIHPRPDLYRDGFYVRPIHNVFVRLFGCSLQDGLGSTSLRRRVPGGVALKVHFRSIHDQKSI